MVCMRAPTMRTFSYIASALVVGSALSCGGDDNIGPVGQAPSRGDEGGSSSSGGSQGGSTSSGNAGSPMVGGSGVGGSEGLAGTNVGVADASDVTPAPMPEAGPSGRDLSTNRDSFFGDSRCASANVLLCEDFESGTIDKSIWKVSGSPVIDGRQKARGSHALHITMNTDGRTSLSETKTFPVANDTYYGRLFIYFNSLPADPMTYAHWTIAAATGTDVSGEIRVSGQLQQKVNRWGVGTDNRVDPNGTGDWTNADKDPNGMPRTVPLNEWMCIEWMHKGDTSETKFWWDGVEHPSLDTVPTTKHGGNPGQPFYLPKFTALWLGWQEYQTSTQKWEMWIDEVIIKAKSASVACFDHRAHGEGVSGWGARGERRQLSAIDDGEARSRRRRTARWPPLCRSMCAKRADAAHGGVRTVLGAGRLVGTRIGADDDFAGPGVLGSDTHSPARQTKPGFPQSSRSVPLSMTPSQSSSKSLHCCGARLARGAQGRRATLAVASAPAHATNQTRIFIDLVVAVVVAAVAELLCAWIDGRIVVVAIVVA